MENIRDTTSDKFFFITSTGFKHSHSVCNSLVKRAFHHESFLTGITFVGKKFNAEIFPSTASLWNMLPWGCFPEDYNRNPLIPRVDSYLFAISP